MNNFFTKIGINKTIFYTISSRLIQGAGGFITLFFILKELNVNEQGYYFTFGSILAIRLFFELGINNIIIQFVAYEKASLDLNNNSFKILNDYSASRLSSISSLILNWYPRLALILFLSLYFFGYYFFSGENDQVVWYLPWIILCFSTTLNFILAPFYAFFEGLGYIEKISLYRLIQTFFSMTFTWIFLIIDFKLFSSPLAALIGVLIAIFLFQKMFLNLFINIRKIKVSNEVSYINEVFPLQWKLAVSWISGYFIFQLFNPLVFKFIGADQAAKMGTSLAVLSSILFIGVSWIQTKTPQISELISKKKYFELDLMFNKALIQSMFVSFTILTLFNITVFTINYFNISFLGVELSNKFLDSKYLILISFAFLFNNFLGCIAIYLRSHKKEPLLVNSFVYALCSTISSFILINLFGIYQMLLSYMLISIIISFWGFNIFRKFKIKYH